MNDEPLIERRTNIWWWFAVCNTDFGVESVSRDAKIVFLAVVVSEQSRRYPSGLGYVPDRGARVPLFGEVLEEQIRGCGLEP